MTNHRGIANEKDKRMIYIMRGTEGNSIKYGENIEPIPLAFDQDAVSICLCTSNKYAPYCGITIQSIIENSSLQNCYDILILEHDISMRNKLLILSLIQEIPNFSIRFINMTQGLKDIKIRTWAHFSPVACFKIFLMSKSFSQYRKILTLDTDLIFTHNAAELYSIHLGNSYMAAVDDVIMKMHVFNDKKSSGYAPVMPVREYISEYLGFGSDEHYYNTGVALINLDICRKEGLFNIALSKLKTKGYSYQEQDVLNELFSKRIIDLDPKWNVVGTEQSDAIIDFLPEEQSIIYQDSLAAPYVIHFAGGLKPWIYNDVPYSELFYRYAKNTPWYESILERKTINYTNYVQRKVLEQVQHERTFRAWLKRTFNRLFPVGTFRRNVFNKLFPRGKGIREYIRILYVNAVDLRDQTKNENITYKTHLEARNAYIPNLKKPLHENAVLLDSKNGTDLAGNIFRIIVELCSNPEYSQFNLFLTYTEKEKERIKTILSQYSLSCRVVLVEWRSKKYFQYLATSKYIITDLYVPPEYIKREGQILVSTAHGTPIKVMGRDCHTETQGNLQRTHTLADFQTFPSNYMKEKLFHAFMEEHLYTGCALKSGYCRNDIFFDKERRKSVRSELGYDGKQVYAYLPTFRGIAGNFQSKKQVEDVLSFCKELDAKLSEKEILLIKLHNFNASLLDLNEFKHIAEFPEGYEVYDVLNATDVLISDYSSVFFDYANSRNKIVLFQYDFEEYLSERGVYLTWKDLPFPIVSTVNELYAELQKPKNYDDTAFLEKYCTYDSINSTKRVCQTIFQNKHSCEKFENEQHRKKNIFFYVGALDLRTPETFFVQEYLKRLDLKKYNYFIYFYEYDLFSRAHILENLPEDVQYFSFLEYSVYPWKERRKWRKGQFDRMQNEIRLGSRKCFSNLPIDLFVIFDEKDPFVLQTIKYLPCPKYIVRHDENTDKCDDDEDTINIIHLPLGYSSETLDRNAETIERKLSE